MRSKAKRRRRRRIEWEKKRGGRRKSVKPYVIEPGGTEGQGKKERQTKRKKENQNGH